MSGLRYNAPIPEMNGSIYVYRLSVTLPTFEIWGVKTTSF